MAGLGCDSFEPLTDFFRGDVGFRFHQPTLSGLALALRNHLWPELDLAREVANLLRDTLVDAAQVLQVFPGAGHGLLEHAQIQKRVGA